jgi:hypothetical protein
VDSDKFTFTFFLLYSGRYAKVYRAMGDVLATSRILGLGI